MEHRMSRVLITGSADGLGRLAAQQLIGEGHDVWLHARNPGRADEALAAAPGAAGVLAGDLANLSETRDLAERANAVGRFDAVIHNAGIGYQQAERGPTADDLAAVFQINVLAPYVLTALIAAPKRLVYLSSGLHRSGKPGTSDLGWSERPWNGLQAYSDSKLLDAILAAGIARRWPHVLSNAVEPGWVATKMGGPGAPDDLALGADTQAWLAVSDDAAATVTGGYFFHRDPADTHPAVRDPAAQDALIDACAELSGVELASAD
jgi:NAD(P)-dependent dehydrogenase (short-subunit alcohol dehydrogenase family)